MASTMHERWFSTSKYEWDTLSWNAMHLNKRDCWADTMYGLRLLREDSPQRKRHTIKVRQQRKTSGFVVSTRRFASSTVAGVGEPLMHQHFEDSRAMTNEISHPTIARVFTKIAFTWASFTSLAEGPNLPCAHRS